MSVVNQKNNNATHLFPSFVLTLFILSGLFLTHPTAFSKDRVPAGEIQWVKGNPDASRKPRDQLWYVQVREKCGFTIGYGKAKNQSFILACSGEVLDARQCYQDFKKNLKTKAPPPVKQLKGQHLNCRWKDQPEILEQSTNQSCQIGVGIAVCGPKETNSQSLPPGVSPVNNEALKDPTSATDPSAPSSLPSSPSTSSTSASDDRKNQVSSKSSGGLGSSSSLPPRDSDLSPPPGTVETLLACQPDQAGNANNCFNDTSIQFNQPKPKPKPQAPPRRRRGSDAGSAQ